MAQPKVYVTRMIAQEALDLIQQHADMRVWPEEVPPSYEVLKGEAVLLDGLLTTVEDRVDGELMDAAPGLKVISQMAVGCDNIALAEATRRGIPVGHTPGVLSRTTAEMAFALMMAAARRVAESDRFVRTGRWQFWHPRAFVGVDLLGSTLGIVGMGRVGLEMARMAHGFDMKIVYHSRTRKQTEEVRYDMEWMSDLPSLLRRADFVSLHVPLTDETHHLIGERELALMKPSAMLINVARGPVVDPWALYQALKGTIAAAAVDVTEPEPIDPHDPLLTMDNFTVTSHIGSASAATRTKMAMMAAENLLAGLKGEIPPFCINREGLER